MTAVIWVMIGSLILAMGVFAGGAAVSVAEFIYTLFHDEE